MSIIFITEISIDNPIIPPDNLQNNFSKISPPEYPDHPGIPPKPPESIPSYASPRTTPGISGDSGGGPGSSYMDVENHI